MVVAMPKRKPVTKEQKNFRLAPEVLEALRVLSSRAMKSETETLEWLIEEEFRKRVQRGDIPSDQDPFDLMSTSRKLRENDGLTH